MKRKMMKSFISLGMVACMLAGCGNGGDLQESSRSSQETLQESSDGSSSEESQEASSGNEGQYPDYLNLDSYRPIVKDGEDVTLKIAVTRSISTVNSDNAVEDAWFVQFIEQKLNINLEIEDLTGADAGERKNLMLASDNLPDIVFGIGITHSDIVQYGVEGGMFLPMSDYFSEELTPYTLQVFEEHEAAKKAFTATDGKIYTLPIINAVRPGRPDTFGRERVFIDTKYLEAVNLEEAPKTLDDFVDMCRAFKELDPATMGVDEIYPILSTSTGTFEDYLMKAFGWVGSSTVSPVWDETEQAIVVPCLQEKYADYVRLMNTLYTEGMLHPDYYTMDETEVRALMAERKDGVLADAAPYLSMDTGWEDFIAASPLSSEWCPTPISQKSSAYEESGILISADTQYPEVCMRLLDYFYSPEGSVYWINGAPQGSEDTLGIIEGFTLSEDGSGIVFPEVQLGEYDSDWTFQTNKIMMASLVNDNRKYRVRYAKEMLGVENPPDEELDLTNPDDHYCYQVYVAQNPYLVDPLPEAYMSVEQGKRYADLRTVLSDYVTSETAKFVVGQRPLEELDQFTEELKGMNGEEYLELCREIYANYSR